MLDPDVVVRVDAAAARPGAPPQEVRGAKNWAKGAMAFAAAARHIHAVLIDGAVGLVWAPRGRLLRALRFEISGGRIVRAEVLTDPDTLSQLQLATLDPPHPDNG